MIVCTRDLRMWSDIITNVTWYGPFKGMPAVHERRKLYASVLKRRRIDLWSYLENRGIGEDRFA